MNYAEFKDHAGILGRFATIREGAPEPSDRIVVQANAGELKFIAGIDYDESRASVVVSAGPTTSQGTAVVNARTFLSAAKSLRGKGEIEFEITKAGCALRTSTGNEVTLGNVATRLPDLLRPAESTAGVSAPVGFCEQASRLLGAATSMSVAAWKQVGFEVAPQAVYLRGGDTFMYTSLEINEGHENPMYGAVNPLFLDAVKELSEPRISWNDTQLIVEQWPYRAATDFMSGYPILPQPPRTEPPDTYIKMGRKDFVEAVKTLTDEKVTLNVTPRDAILAGWPTETTSLKLKAQTSGRGRMAVMRDRLVKLATAFTGDEVTLAWNSEESGPCRLWGRDGLVFLARIPLY